jgi:hypothetical protein
MKLLLKEPYIWKLNGTPDVDYTVKSINAGCGNGVCVRVTPALQPNHPCGEDVWYDLNHFVEVEQK